MGVGDPYGCSHVAPLGVAGDAVLGVHEGWCTRKSGAVQRAPKGGMAGGGGSDEITQSLLARSLVHRAPGWRCEFCGWAAFSCTRVCCT